MSSPPGKPNDTEALSPEDQVALKQTLLERLAELQQIDALSEDSRRPVELDQNSVGRLSRMDAIQQQAMAFASQGRRQHDARRISQALSRMATGDYGDCGACGEPIALRRLQLDPTLAMCIECASE
ncbi:TraR/DksA family transcriptional regulator [Brevundimonas sp. DC300-4]|uniref:TraR/DksA family transcriptional regulator n=1 Tax=Brevundimonas sp. DC300-4 TaxID=2804594 RepID=UPI003CED8545